jgi:hypothetical protein
LHPGGHYNAAVTTTEPNPTSAALVTEPVQPLDYGRPERRAGGPASVRDTILGIAISLLLGLGAGAIAFGLLIVGARIREPEATVIAAGITAITIAVSLLVLLLWLRRAGR